MAPGGPLDSFKDEGRGQGLSALGMERELEIEFNHAANDLTDHAYVMKH